MRKICPLLILSFLTLTIKAQHNKAYQDSIRFYERQIQQWSRAFLDSMRQHPEYIRLMKELQSLRIQSDDYKAFSLYTAIHSANFSKFNSQVAAANFSPLKGSPLAIGVGYSSKRKRLIFDLNISAFGINKASRRGPESIKTAFSTMFQLEFGYNLLKNGRINAYPYAGLGLRSSNLIYRAPVTTNALFSNPADIVQNNQSFEAYNTRLGYQGGIGLEYIVTSRRKKGGTILFIKSGTNMPFKKKAFEIEGINYDPDFKYGYLNGSIGFKFFGR